MVSSEKRKSLPFCCTLLNAHKSAQVIASTPGFELARRMRLKSSLSLMLRYTSCAWACAVPGDMTNEAESCRKDEMERQLPGSR
eukprot:CAMPEP_0170307166 /NCGR_PEP_ID=MMETSP0116_2-20130129/53990_1 /TAXON_ID=400756 /ORGANISM="Durinskia baltica, Strain CSIRO CS-38" /LENGTH=83 /DNA_ID=CAMNT_0010559283 /DNA_START=40 /DNA_END=288 /DNA_ORIENTATION=-